MYAVQGAGVWFCVGLSGRGYVEHGPSLHGFPRLLEHPQPGAPAYPQASFIFFIFLLAEPVQF